ncbi:invasion associated locus B family protein [Martelella lutilitoris]|nr:invasion associated locus B family protein [Martelella lutilitoris]
MKTITGFVALAGALLITTAASAQQSEPVAASDTTVSYGDWSQHCMLVQIQKADEKEPGPPQRVCEATQTLNVQQQDGGQVQRILTVAVGSLPGVDAPRLVVQTPSNVDLRAGVSFTVGGEPAGQPVKGGAVGSTDAGKELKMTYVTCGQVCAADMELSAAQLKELKETKSASVTFKIMNGQQIALPLSMKGFSAAVSAAPPVN